MGRKKGERETGCERCEEEEREKQKEREKREKGKSEFTFVLDTYSFRRPS